MLSIKRREYEYRVFLVPELLGLTEAHYLQVGSLKETIDKIILSPKASETRVKRLKTLFAKKYNLHDSVIEKSKLYDIEHFKKEYGFG